MQKFADGVVKHKKLVAIIALLLLIPSAFGYLNTRVNYDLLTYLPEDMETVQGQEILLDDFGKGSFALITFEGMEDKDIVEMKKQFEELEYIDSVIWYDTAADISIPREMLPDDIYDVFNSEDATLMAAFMNVTISSDEAIQTITDMRKIANDHVYVASLSAFVTDLKAIGDHETPLYAAIATLLACIVMSLFLDSFLIPWLFILSIGIAIIINLGSNIVFGEISYITQAICAVLQLGVTMDYSIFLWNSFKEHKVYIEDDNEAMSQAIQKTLLSISASSVTTIAGFISLCFMGFTLGLDLGIVMAKGVIFGVITAVTVLPSFLLICMKGIRKTKHRPLMFKTEKPAEFILKHRRIIAVLYVVILVPALFGYLNTEKYYDLDQSIPKDTPCTVANEKLQEDFGMYQTHMLLCDADLPAKEVRKMTDEISDVKGINAVLAQSSLLGTAVPSDMLPGELTGTFSANGRQLIIITSAYRVATDEINRQIDEINAILDKYDKDGILIGESACTQSLIDITNHDFTVVTAISVLAVLVIIAISLMSGILPILLVAVIELAIFINLGIPFFTGSVVAFIMPICVSTIQLGSTVDYAILMTTRYKRERMGGFDRYEAVKTALATSMPSIIVSALGFFAATIGVAIISDIDLVGSMCGFMARGALISMTLVILVLPSFLYMFDGIICRTTRGMRLLAGKKVA